MNKKKIAVSPPYPRVGEIIQIFVTAFDTKPENQEMRKKLDRLAREGDFDSKLHSRVIDELLLKPLNDFDSDYSDFVKRFINFLIEEYVKLISEIALDAMERSDSLPILVKKIGAPYIGNFITLLKDEYGGPDIAGFLKKDRNAVDIVFQWGKSSLDMDIRNLPSFGEKQTKDNIARWCRGEAIPSFFQSIYPIKRDLEKMYPEQKSKILLFGKWLLTARAFCWFVREAQKSNIDDLVTHIGQGILLNFPRIDIGKILSAANSADGIRFIGIGKCCASIMARYLNSKKKEIGDQDSARREINHLESLIDAHDPAGCTRYMLNWCEGRWHILSGLETEALAFYEKAVEQSLYRAGGKQKIIMGEALALAGHLNKKTVMKKLKHSAITMAYFLEDFVDRSDVVADWEVEQFAQSYSRLFPLQICFLEASEGSKRRTPPYPVKLLCKADLEKMKPDLSNPDRVRAWKGGGGSNKRCPQLMWFASENRVADVQALLDAGADVNISDQGGGSALLYALQSAEDGFGRQALDLLLEVKHQEATLNRMTEKKRLSPLYVAVCLGDPIVVEKLLRMGADPNLKAKCEPQSALYTCVGRLAYYREGWGETHLKQKLNSSQKENFEASRRYLGGLVGSMGDQMILDDNFKAILDTVIKVGVSKITTVPKENFFQIAKILLEFGACPNQAHISPAPGRTPLMLAAEIGAVDIFDLMMQHHGD